MDRASTSPDLLSTEATFAASSPDLPGESPLPTMEINGTRIHILEHCSQRVVTLSMIDAVHRRPDGTAGRNFRTNKSRFIEGEDYWKISADEFRRRFPGVISERATEEVTLVGEAGYLMLVKSFQDDLAWEVQRKLVKTYFTAQQATRMPAITDAEFMARAVLLAQSTIAQLEAKQAADQPKVKFYDRFADADGLYNLQNAGRAIGMGPNKFVQRLKQEHLFYQGGSLVAKQQYIKAQLFEMKSSLDDQGKTRFQTFVTPKGVQHFAKKFGPDLLSQEIH